MATFKSFANVQEWVAAHSIDELHAALLPGSRFSMSNREYGSAWLRQQTEDGKVAREDEAHEFMRRQTAAAERTSRVAWLSMWISLAALFVAAWPAFDPLKLDSRHPTVLADTARGGE